MVDDTQCKTSTFFECKQYKMWKAGLQEEMPVYLLNAITKEKPVHPVYGNLRY